ncbi:hypothetical protein DSUL_100133 [Desulfovibrionales bacterium]
MNASSMVQVVVISWAYLYGLEVIEG